MNPILWDENGPFFAYNIYFNYLLYEKVENEDVRVLLDGLMVDATVSYGTELFMDLITNGQWKKFYDEVRGLSERNDINQYKVLGYQLFVALNNLLIDKINFEKLYPIYRENEIVKRVFLEKMDFKEQLKFYFGKKLRIDDKALEHHFNSLNSGMIQYVLEDADRLSSQFSVEPRYPFLDIRLVEFCLAIPTTQKRSYGWDRAIMRKAMTDILPAEIQWRKRKMYGANSAIKNFIAQDKKFIEEIIHKNDQLIHEYLTVDVLDRSFIKLENNNQYLIYGLLSPYGYG